MTKSLTRTRSLLLLLAIVFASFGHVESQIIKRNGLVARQVIPTLGVPTASANSPTNTATATATATSATLPASAPPTSTSSTPPPTDTSTTSTSSSVPPSTTSSVPPSTTSSTPNTSTTQTQTQQSATQSTLPPVTSEATTINADGSTIIVTTVVTPTLSSASASSSSTADSDTGSSSGSGVTTSTIVGLSVAGGIAVLGVIAFFVWKLTRKRFSADYDDEAIKWPELNAHGEVPTYAVPTNPTGKAGIGLESTSEFDLTRNESVAGLQASSASHYSQASGAESVANLYAPSAGDPYAVPPLPHLNPNMTQPYHDDPGYGPQTFYDPYRGPLPQTFNDGASVDSHAGYPGEAIPMNMLPPGGAAGRRSPGPQMAYEGGRASPGPSLGGRQSPGPGAAYGGGGYGGAYGDGRRSPAPAAALGGRRSPGPGPAYGGGI